LVAASDPSPSGYAEGNGPDIGIQLLEALLRTQEYRTEVWKDDLKKMGTIQPSEGDSETESGAGQGLIGGLISILRIGLQNSSSSAFTSKNSSAVNSGANTPRNGATTATSSSGSSNGNGNALAPPGGSSGNRTPGIQGLAGPQMQYQCIFCLWLLTFNEEIAAELNT